MRYYQNSRRNGSVVSGVLMIIVTIIICSILSYCISIWAIFPIGFAILGAWMLLNIRAGTSGLIDTVAYGFYFYLRKGFSPE